MASEEDNASLTVIGPDGRVLEGTEEALSTKEWRLGSASEGTYGIYIGPTRGNATYSLTVRTAAGERASSGTLTVEGDLVCRQMPDGAVSQLGQLARSDAFTGFGPTYAHSPDGRAIANIGVTEGGYALYVGRVDEETPRKIEATGEPDYRSKPVWAPDSTRFAFAQNDLMWIYDLETRTVRVIARPEKEYGEVVDPSFSEDGTRLYFYTGSRFEYNFQGERYSVLGDGSDMRPEPEVTPKYPGEDLRGPEGK